MREKQCSFNHILTIGRKNKSVQFYFWADGSKPDAFFPFQKPKKFATIRHIKANIA